MHDLGHVSWVGSVLRRSAQHLIPVGSDLDYLERDLSGVRNLIIPQPSNERLILHVIVIFHGRFFRLKGGRARGHVVAVAEMIKCFADIVFYQ